MHKPSIYLYSLWLISITSHAASLDRFLYCLKTHSRTKNPIELPNDRCCPTVQTEDDQGQPYSSTITGCCMDILYDLDLQFCCQSGIRDVKNEFVTKVYSSAELTPEVMS